MPLNNLCRPLVGDTPTLPLMQGMSIFLLEEGEVLTISSEDIRCFFYILSVPEEWKKFLGFAKVVPDEALPQHLKGRVVHLVSRVLPMGFINSVAIAQHIHRNVVRHAALRNFPPVMGEQELRKDKRPTSSKQLFRIYLDNFDELTRCDEKTALLVQGVESPMVDPKLQKCVIYAMLGLEVLRRGRATQRKLQVVCGGFVYAAMFRRPLLGALNRVWEYIVEMGKLSKRMRHPLPAEVKWELARFVALLPLAYMDFRSARSLLPAMLPPVAEVLQLAVGSAVMAWPQKEREFVVKF